MKASDFAQALQTCFAKKDWAACANMTKAAIDIGIVVSWNGQRFFNLSWDYWKPDQPGFKQEEWYQLSYELWGKPSPPYKLGNYWAGGASGNINCIPNKGNQILSAMEFEQAMTALKTIT